MSFAWYLWRKERPTITYPYVFSENLGRLCRECLSFKPFRATFGSSISLERPAGASDQKYPDFAIIPPSSGFALSIRPRWNRSSARINSENHLRRFALRFFSEDKPRLSILSRCFLVPNAAFSTRAAIKRKKLAHKLIGKLKAPVSTVEIATRSSGSNNLFGPWRNIHLSSRCMHRPIFDPGVSSDLKFFSLYAVVGRFDGGCRIVFATDFSILSLSLSLTLKPLTYELNETRPQNVDIC